MFTGTHGQTSNRLNLSMYSSLTAANIQDKQQVTTDEICLDGWWINASLPSTASLCLPLQVCNPSVQGAASAVGMAGPAAWNAGVLHL